MTDPALTSATTLVDQVDAGDVTPTEAAEAALDGIESHDDEINAFVTVTDELAQESATERAAIDSEDRGPLHGVPVGLKDLSSMREGTRHTFGSKLFEDFVAPRTSAVVERLEDAGAIVVGKTNTPEFGHKGVTQNEVAGATASPIDPSLNAGGSSGGSAAAVAAGMVPIATGSDAGGSIRIPAAACGVYGLKPSYGLVPSDSRPNAFGGKRHHVTSGPIARHVEDAALMLDVMAGPHPADPGSVPVEIDPLAAVERPVDDLKIGYNPAFDGTFPTNEAGVAVIEDALGAFEQAGATVEAVDLGLELEMEDLKDAVVPTFTAEMVETVAVMEHARGIDIREHADVVSDSLLAMLAVGDQQSIADVATTGIVRTQVFDAVQSVFEEYDLLVTQTLTRLGTGLHEDFGYEAWEATMTWPFNWTGHPAASLPAGLTAEGMPVGLQLIGPRYDDETVLAASAAFERERPWDDIYPR